MAISTCNGEQKMGEPVADFETERIARKDNWTPLEALEQCLAEIKSGRLNPRILTVILEHAPNAEHPEMVSPVHFSSEMTSAEFLAMLKIQEIRTLREWLGPLWAPGGQ
jgi:hypothetical protein